MKPIIFLFLFSLPAICHSQTVVIADASARIEPTTQLYQRVHESLSIGDTRLAMSLFKEVINIYEVEGRVKELSESYLGMALAFAFNGHYSESIRYHKKALRAHHKYRSNESDDAIRLNLGLAYQLAGKERKARRLLQNI